MRVRLALTVVDAASGRAQDVLVSGDAGQRVAALGELLAEQFGYATRAGPAPARFSLRVQRTGEQLAPEATLAASDLLEGDVLTLSVSDQPPPGPPRWPELGHAGRLDAGVV